MEEGASGVPCMINTDERETEGVWRGMRGAGEGLEVGMRGLDGGGW